MKRRTLVGFGLALLGILGTYVWPWPQVSRWRAVDRCLDHGGCWDYQASACEFEDQEKCDSRTLD